MIANPDWGTASSSSYRVEASLNAAAALATAVTAPLLLARFAAVVVSRLLRRELSLSFNLCAWLNSIDGIFQIFSPKVANLFVF